LCLCLLTLNHNEAELRHVLNAAAYLCFIHSGAQP
jgi:hypothetical protein